MRRIVPVLVAFLAASPVAAQKSVPRVEPQPFASEGTFRDDDGKVAHDLSGIACTPESAGGSRTCLLINDEDRAAQSAMLAGGVLKAGPRIPLFRNKAPARTHGKPQPTFCREGAAKFRDLDGEGVAYAAPYFYVTGSHGCARNGKSRTSTFLLARLRLDEQGRAIDAGDRAASGKRATRQAIDLTFRLGAVLAAAPRIGDFFGKDLDQNGVNVEGVAVMGNVLYAGIRAPSLDGETFIVATPVDALFADADVPPPKPVLLTMPLGRDTGVRDLSALPDGRLLVLYGSAQDQPEVPYGVATFDPATGAFLKLGELSGVSADGRDGKAEAILPLGRTSNRLDVMVLYDSLANGAPRRFSLPIP
ncbi:MAG: hypothetical protein JWL62_2778 [Hyphomicrobiales bacterium]|nr:hypothetical protein [Hyphomicrobiales bacterium]